MLLVTDVVIALLSTFVILFTSCFLFFKWKVAAEEEKQPVYVIQIIEALLKVCPLGPPNQWTLLETGVGLPRCWHRGSPLRLWGQISKICGCSVIIEGSSPAVLRVICSAENWKEWNTSATLKSFFHRQFEDHQLRDDDYMHCMTVCSGADVEFYMFSHLGANDKGWILLWNTKKVEWSFFLLQPMKKHGHVQCIMTCISGISCAKQIMFSLNSIKDAVEMENVSVVQLSTAPKAHDKTSENYLEWSEKSVPNCFSVHSRRVQLKKQDKPSTRAFRLVPHFSNWRAIRRIKSFSLSVEIVMENDIGCSKDWISRSLHSVMKQNDACLEHGKEKSHRKKRRFRLSNSYSSSCINLNFRRKSEESGNSDTRALALSPRRSKTLSVITEVENKLQTPLHQRWYSDSNLHAKQYAFGKSSSLENLPEEMSSGSEIERKDPVEGGGSSKEMLLTAAKDDGNEQCISDFEVLLPQIESSDHRTADILTKGNYCASQLQAKILEAACVDQSSSNNGWMFHSSYKGTTVLSKVSHYGSLKILSYICTTDISLSPPSVWKFVRNPHSRFICDETVKKVKILEEISEDQKIIHTYHETGSLLKKNTVDFCLLHTERQEQTKYYLAFSSMEYANCPLMMDTTRGILLPSGWVVEPYALNEEKSKITYLYQIIDNNPSSHYIHELSSSLPVSIFNLKSYLMLKPSSI